MMNIIDSINDSLKDCLLIIDRDLLDQAHVAELFDQLNKIIIATTLLARVFKNVEGSQSFLINLNQNNLQLLSILKLISKSIKNEDISQTHDLIRLELRDSLIMWIIQTIPQMRSGATDHLSGFPMNSETNLRS